MAPRSKSKSLAWLTGLPATLFHPDTHVPLQPHFASSTFLPTCCFLCPKCPSSPLDLVIKQCRCVVLRFCRSGGRPRSHWTDSRVWAGLWFFLGDPGEHPPPALFQLLEMPMLCTCGLLLHLQTQHLFPCRVSLHPWLSKALSR